MALKTASMAAVSRSETIFADGSDAPRAGADLRAARERLGWSVPDVAAMLRIRPAYLDALEVGRLNQLPGNVYALGFLRGYATALGLDPEEMVRRFKGEAVEMVKSTELVFPTPVPERGLPAGALILLGLVLVGGAYAGWYRLSGEGKLPPETVARMPARLAPLAEQALPGPDGRVPVPVTPKAVARVEENDQFEPRQAAAENPLFLPDPPPAPPEEVAVAVAPSGPIGGTPTTALAMPVNPPMRAPDPATRSAPASADPAAADGARVVLRFTGDTWVQVKEKGGPTLLSRMMKAGETFPVPTKPNLLLTTGNAGRTEILVDGTLAPPIGGAGSVRSNVPMDPDQLKAGTVTPASTRR